MSNTDTTKSTAPTHIAYQIREGSKQSYWTQVGAGWPHKDGKGFTIMLDSIPLDGKISVRLAAKDN